MNLIKQFTVTPMGKPRMTRRDRWSKRKCVLNYYQFKDRLKEEAGSWLPAESGTFLYFLIPMPPSWSKKKRSEMLGKAHKQKPDIDNLIKTFLDALLEDDSRVSSIAATKVWAANPGIWVGEFKET